MWPTLGLSVLGTLGAIVGGVALVVYWDEIVNWLKDLVLKIKNWVQSLKQKLTHAAAMFVQKVEGALAAIRHKLYYKEQGQWFEQTTTRKIDESQLPASIKNKLGYSENDVTDEMEAELGLEI